MPELLQPFEDWFASFNFLLNSCISVVKGSVHHLILSTWQVFAQYLNRNHTLLRIGSNSSIPVKQPPVEFTPLRKNWGSERSHACQNCHFCSGALFSNRTVVTKPLLGWCWSFQPNELYVSNSWSRLEEGLGRSSSFLSTWVVTSTLN